jgi:hypothetical protein
MKKIEIIKLMLTLFLVFLMAAPPWVIAQGTQGTEESKTFKQEELDQMLAPIALYPDDLLTQILMASTYPLEIVQADRWTKQNKSLKGDALTEALEKQDWDPSVKSLVNFPEVLSRMSEDLRWTQQLGDAFLAQEKQVMDTIQMLRKKAQEAGNLKDNPQQKVVVEQETIIIESANPQVIYVPSYNPAVVYGGWWWPAYPPPPPFFPFFPYATPYAYGAMAFGAGVARAAAWGYAWGHANWHGGDVNINASRNTNINNNINRDKYKADMKNKGLGEGGQGKWQHDASHRGGVSYRDQGTAQKYNKASTREASQARDSFRGRGDQGSKDLSRGGGDRASTRPADRGGSERGGRDSAFGGGERGSDARQQSSRGSSSRQSMSSGGGSGSRGSSGGGGGGGGGGGRGGGGGGRR